MKASIYCGILKHNDGVLVLSFRSPQAKTGQSLYFRILLTDSGHYLLPTSGHERVDPHQEMIFLRKSVMKHLRDFMNLSLCNRKQLELRNVVNTPRTMSSNPASVELSQTALGCPDSGSEQCTALPHLVQAVIAPQSLTRRGLPCTKLPDARADPCPSRPDERSSHRPGLPTQLHDERPGCRPCSHNTTLADFFVNKCCPMLRDAWLSVEGTAYLGDEFPMQFTPEKHFHHIQKNKTI